MNLGTEIKILEICGAQRILCELKSWVDVVREVELDEVMGKPKPSSIRMCFGLDRSS